MSEKDLGLIPELCPCDSCGHLIPTERAYADMETLTVLCPPCLREKLRPCEECGSLIRAAAYQHLSSGRVICEPCVAKRLFENRSGNGLNKSSAPGYFDLYAHDEAGGSQGEPRITITTHLWLPWSDIAIRQFHLAREARSRAQAIGPHGEGIGTAQRDEWYASMVSIAACSHALDAVYGAVRRPAGITDAERQKWGDNETPRGSQILETLKRGFAVGPIQAGLVGDFSWLFDLRNAELHFDEKPKGPMPHPTGTNVAPEQVSYSLESAERAIGILLKVLKACVESPKQPLDAWAAGAREPVRLLVESVGKST